VDSEFGTPLRKFYGILDSYVPEPASGYEGTRINLNFKDVDVLQSTEPYNFPTAIINIGQSNRKKSRWGYFGTSLGNLIPENEDIEDIIGKKIGMVFCDGLEDRPAAKPIWSRDADRAKYPDGELPTPVWVVFEVEGQVAGSGVSTATEQAKRLLDGKTVSEFNKAAYADPVIKRDTELQRSITDKSFIKAMTASGEFKKDENDVYHRLTS
jgi:hypothetical protein